MANFEITPDGDIESMSNEERRRKLVEFLYRKMHETGTAYTTDVGILLQAARGLFFALAAQYNVESDWVFGEGAQALLVKYRDHAAQARVVTMPADQPVDSPVPK